MSLKDSIGQAISSTRDKKGMTQEQLSGTAGISNRFLQNLEAGEHSPSFATLFKLSRALKVTPDELILPAWKKWLKNPKDI